MQVTWDPSGFALKSAERAGLWLPPASKGDYLRLLSERQAEYWEAAGRRASAEFWSRLTFDWLGLYGFADSAERLLVQADEWLYSSESPVYSHYPETKAVLEAISRRGLPMIVLSNWDDSLDRVLAMHHLAGHFQHILASMVEGFEKPDPRFFTLAQDRLGLAPAEILHVGDRRVDDYDGALAAGWNALHLVRKDNHAGEAYGSREGQIRDLGEVLKWL